MVSPGVISTQPVRFNPLASCYSPNPSCYPASLVCNDVAQRQTAVPATCVERQVTCRGKLERVGRKTQTQNAQAERSCLHGVMEIDCALHRTSAMPPCRLAPAPCYHSSPASRGRGLTVITG